MAAGGRAGGPFRGLALTTRLTLAYALVSLAVLLCMGLLLSLLVARHFDELDREALSHRIRAIDAIALRSSSAGDLRDRLEQAWPSGEGDVRVMVEDTTGAVLFASPGFDVPAPWRRDAPAGPFGAMTWRDGHRSFRVASASAAIGSPGGDPLRVWAALDSGQHAHFLADLRAALWLYVAFASLLSALLGWGVARRGLAPLTTMKARAQAVTSQRLDPRMPVAAVPVEMADLAASLNEMLDRLQDDFRRLSDFSSDLAHELRTPISNLLTQTQVALAQPRDAATYRDVLASNAEEFDRLARTVSDMLFLAKTENGLALPNPERVVLADEVRALLDYYEAVADEKGVTLNLQGDAEVVGDRLMLRRAIGNLLSNALRHTPCGGRVTVGIADASSGVSVGVANTGDTIPPDVLPRLFDRFRRGHAARARPDSDGAGLGLSITRAIAQAHGGTVTATSEAGLTRFTLVLPRPAARLRQDPAAIIR